MGTTAQKLEYLGTTKSQLKDMINYGLDDNNKITNSTTFRNYVSSIFNAFLEALRTPDTLFTNLPKKSGTGANITLNDTANAPMRITLGASELTQAGTPTPSSPQDIHTISGSNKVVVRGKNLVDIPSITLSGSGYIYNGAINLPAGTYTLSIKNSANCSIAIADENGNNMVTGSHNIPYTFTISNIGKTLKIYSPSAGTFNENQIEVGSTATTYEPYISQEADIDLKSKNLFDIDIGSQTISGIKFTVNADNSITAKGTATGEINLVIGHIDNLPSGNYFVSGCPAGGTSSTYRLQATDYPVVNNMGYDYGSGVSFTSTGISYALRITIKNGVNISNGITFKPMINKGTTALPYVPYYDYGEYCKIGNYEDKFIRTSGKNELNINQVVGSTITINNDKLTLNASTGYNATDTSHTLGIICPNLKVGETYYLNFNTTETSETHRNDIYLNGSSTYWTKGTSHTITQAELDGRIAFYGINATVSELIISKDNIPYEPYGSNEWYIKKNIGKVVLDGTENWYHGTSGPSGSDQLYTDKFNNMFTETGTTGLTKIKSNYFINIDTVNGMRIGSYVSFFPESSLNLTTAEVFKTYLSNNNVYCNYVLSTPIYIPITGTLAEQFENVYQKLLSYTGQTNISQVNNDLSFNLSVQAIEE